jgi:ribosomal protein S18 acetylase RimI-like enzyme
MSDKMESIRDCAYTFSDAEFEEMWQLLIDSYAITGRPHNWPFAELENWRYATWDEPPAYFVDRVHLWRNEAGELIGFCNRYYETTNLQVHPEYRFVEATMLDWAERNWGGEEARIETRAYEYDTERQALLVQRGYEDLGTGANVHEYDVSRLYPALDLPLGFRIESLAENEDYDGHIATEHATFNSDYLDRNWFDGKSSAPSYSFDWDLCVVSPEGQHVAFALVWIDGQNKVSQIDPVGTHPDFRRRGFAKALLSACFRRLHAAGIRRAYIESAPEPNISNRLYDSLQPVKRYQANRWAKRLS